MNEAAPIRFEVVRFVMSKGDVAFSEVVGSFATEAEATVFCEGKRGLDSALPRWPDYDDYQVCKRES